MEIKFHRGVAYRVKDGKSLSSEAYGPEQSLEEFEAERNENARQYIIANGSLPKNHSGLAENDIPQSVIDAALADSPEAKGRIWDAAVSQILSNNESLASQFVEYLPNLMAYRERRQAAFYIAYLDKIEPDIADPAAVAVIGELRAAAQAAL